MSVKNYNLQYISLLELIKVTFQHRHVFTFLLGYFVSFIEKKVLNIITGISYCSKVWQFESLNSPLELM